MENKTMIKIEMKEKETFKDKVAKHKTVILTGVGVIALGVGAYFGYKRFKINKGTVGFMKSQVKINNGLIKVGEENLGITTQLVEENLNLNIAVDDLTDEIYVIKKTLLDGEIVEQAIATTERQLSFATNKLAKFMKLLEERPDDEDVINTVNELKGKVRHLTFIKGRQLEMKDITNHFEG